MPSGSGGAPRPSSTWHDEQAWALNVGPRPSRASVDAGAVTQFLVKKLSPTSNCRRSAAVRLGAGKRERDPRLGVAGGVATEVGVEAVPAVAATAGRGDQQRLRAVEVATRTAHTSTVTPMVSAAVDDVVGLDVEGLDAGQDAGPTRVVVGNAVGEVLVERRRDRLERGDGRAHRACRARCAASSSADSNRAISPGPSAAPG